jgi:hypothetical protein
MRSANSGVEKVIVRQLKRHKFRQRRVTVHRCQNGSEQVGDVGSGVSLGFKGLATSAKAFLRERHPEFVQAALKMRRDGPRLDAQRFGESPHREATPPA